MQARSDAGDVADSFTGDTPTMGSSYYIQPENGVGLF